MAIRCFPPSYARLCAIAKAMITLRGSRSRSRASPDMKLCGFDAGLDHPLLVIAGSIAARSRGPFGDAPRTRYAERECGKGRTRLRFNTARGASRLFPQAGLRLTSRSRTAEMLVRGPHR